jgi:hypothetical protein
MVRVKSNFYTKPVEVNAPLQTDWFNLTSRQSEGYMSILTSVHFHGSVVQLSKDNKQDGLFKELGVSQIQTN